MKELTLLSPSEIKSLLCCWIEKSFYIGEGDILISEMGFYNKSPNSTVDKIFRADLALANGRLAAFEIKSGYDSLKRWDTQMSGYLNVFDEVWLCCHGKHLSKAFEMTSKNIGILIIDDLGSIAIVRAARKNQLVNIYDLSGLLWREEINEFCSLSGIVIKSRMTKREIRDLLSEQADLISLKKFVLTKIKQRKMANYSSSDSSSDVDNPILCKTPLDIA